MAIESNKTIIVLGASRGIGREVVKLFAKSKNHRVIALSRDLSEMEKSFQDCRNVRSYKIDLTQSNLSQSLDEILSEYESINILVNNAGLLINKPFAELSHKDFTLSYQVNVIGIMQATQAIIKKMDKGHIINISSMGGFQGSVKFPGLTAYSTSKAALVSFTELFAEEHKDTDISMNCLCLGAVQTEMLEEAFPGYQAPTTPEQMAEYIVNFSLEGHQFMNGKIIPLSTSTP